MATRRGPRRAVIAVAALALVLSPAGGVVAVPAPDYPSWDEVTEARADAAAAAREVARIEAALLDLEAEAVRLGRAAQLAAEESFIAEAALAEAEARSGRLAARVVDADARAAVSARSAAHTLLELSRSGGGDPTLALLAMGPRETDDFLRAYSAATRLGENSQALLDRALADRNAVNALAAEAELAEELRATAAEESEARAVAAEQAVRVAAAEAQSQQVHLERLYAQLATLRGTTAELEREYWEGRDAADGPGSPGSDPGSNPAPDPGSDGGSTQPDPEPQPSTAPSQSASPSTAPSTSPSASPSASPSSPSSTPSSPTPNSAKVTTAINYAKSQLGEPYVYAGAGPDGWDCSGLTMKSYAAAGVSIGGHGSTSQYNAMKSAGKLVAASQRQAGDLLFYSDGGSTSGTKYHVAMYLGGGKMIEAPYPGQNVRIVVVRTADLVSLVGRPTA